VEILVEESNPVDSAGAAGETPGDDIRVEQFSCRLDIRASTATAPSKTFVKN